MTDVQFVTENAFGELGLTVTSTFSLLSQFITSLDARSIKAPERPKDPPNTLNLIGDSAKLLKAQVTKLSLLVLNRPFTPTAITRILRDISTGCLPALMGATDLVRQKEDGHILFYIIRAPIRRLFRQMINLMGEVPLHETQVDAVKKTDRGTLVSTGIVWETCDLLIEMEKTGLVGIVVQQAQEYRDLLQDAIAELKEWTESAKRPELNL
ncbi:MAG: hypothetical protein M1830_007867, partial [Pleopsidium flavum]